MRQRPVLAYYALAFAISWAGMLQVIGGPGAIPGTQEQAGRLMPFVAAALLAGPSAAGLFMTALVGGRAGLRDLLARLLRWRVGARWYAIALLLAPLVAVSVLLTLSLRSPLFAAADRAAVLLAGATAGLSTVFEEIGWTGFAVPRLRLRHDIATTGVIVGVLWGLWHLPVNLWVGGAYHGGLPLALFLPLYFLLGVAHLTAFRVLMVWVYDRTGSLFVATLMHASLTASTIFVFTPLTTGWPFLGYLLGLTVLLWLAVALVAVRGALSRELPRTTT